MRIYLILEQGKGGNVFTMRKRILSWLLVVTLALTLFPTAAFAQQAPIENGLWLTPESPTLNVYEASMGTVPGSFY